MTYPDLWDYLRHEALACDDGERDGPSATELAEDQREWDAQRSEALRRHVLAYRPVRQEGATE